ncbi:hypothetical protein KM043_007995 [Ampulex compressa]|nr:hypothetical protein KM043_007995 [Ampulex compressa]
MDQWNQQQCALAIKMFYKNSDSSEAAQNQTGCRVTEKCSRTSVIGAGSTDFGRRQQSLPQDNSDNKVDYLARTATSEYTAIRINQKELMKRKTSTKSSIEWVPVLTNTWKGTQELLKPNAKPQATTSPGCTQTTLSISKSYLPNKERNDGSMNMGGTSMQRQVSKAKRRKWSTPMSTERKKLKKWKQLKDSVSDNPAAATEEAAEALQTIASAVIHKEDHLNYVEILSRIKKDPTVKVVGECVQKVCRTNVSILLIFLNKESSAKTQELRNQFKGALGESATVQSKVQEVELEIKNQEKDAMKQEISVALQSLEILEVVRPLKCFKCWKFGHLSRNCKSNVDRVKDSIRHRNAGHKVVECLASAKCVIRAEAKDGHTQPTSQCLPRNSRGSLGETHHSGQPGKVDAEVSRYMDSGIALCYRSNEEDAKCRRARKKTTHQAAVVETINMNPRITHNISSWTGDVRLFDNTAGRAMAKASPAMSHGGIIRPQRNGGFWSMQVQHTTAQGRASTHYKCPKFTRFFRNHTLVSPSLVALLTLYDTSLIFAHELYRSTATNIRTKRDRKENSCGMAERSSPMRN